MKNHVTVHNIIVFCGLVAAGFVMIDGFSDMRAKQQVREAETKLAVAMQYRMGVQHAQKVVVTLDGGQQIVLEGKEKEIFCRSFGMNENCEGRSAFARG